ncbi:hypothetical protein [Actinomadura parmotrematis]|uniref:Uncharacterized protein n=1 Tax=Actinomadura parmotrematis TaxID=2864039 RepID=A0ABS7FZW8_9ACTN|nr:hypothetical protein [Actinomadura parmotrematis]MBW8485801.1 hypothetical protein [Actinomadura parmotrematis]
MRTGSMDDPAPGGLWNAFVAAKKDYNGHQAAFHQQVRDRTAVLARALDQGGWDRATALAYMAEFGGDTLPLLPRLVELSLSHGLAGDVRAAIAGVPRDDLLPALEPLVLDRLVAADDDEYRRLAELLDHVRAWDALARLLDRARASGDPRIRDVAAEYE